MQWMKKREKTLKKFKTHPLVKKIMASVFWVNQGILLVEHFWNMFWILEWYVAGIEKLLPHYNKCLDSLGNYAEK